MPRINSIVFFVIFLIAVFFLSLDSVISEVKDFLSEEISSPKGVMLFVSISIIFIITSVVLFRVIQRDTAEIRTNLKSLKVLHFITIASQSTLIVALVIVTVQIILFSYYYTILLTVTVVVSATSAAAVMAISSLILLEWYKSNRKSYAVLIFGAAFAINAYSFVYTTVADSYTLAEKSPVITSSSEVIYPTDSFAPGSVRLFLSDMYQYSSTASFVMLVAGSALMLRHYSSRLGSAKFWTLVLLPLVYYLSTLVDTLGIYIPETDAELFNYYIYTSLNGIIGGIFLGLSFWIVSRSMKPNKSVTNYLRLSAIGFTLLWIATVGAVSVSSFPPFGFASFSMLSLSSYMIILGLYSTAISISQDVRLRQYIRDLTKADTGFLSTIGQAQLEKQVQSKALALENVVKEQRVELEKKSGIKSSVEEQDIRQYLLEVLQEVDKHKSSK